MVSCHLNHDDVEYKLNETKTYKRDFSTVLHERGEGFDDCTLLFRLGISL
jgi:hypothetical protein